MELAGIDVGSRTIELVALEGEQVALRRRTETTYDPLAQCRTLMDGVDGVPVVATGYGRKLFAEAFHAPAVTEIRAYALGARHLFPACRAVLDIGGQDTKAIALGPRGRVEKFEMNDRCAAGTGKFLEFMAAAFGVPVEDFGPYALKGRPGLSINSMCTVFAQTEATSLMARGQRAEDIALALHHSVVRRSLAMVGRVAHASPLVFAGGVARNPCIVELLRGECDLEVLVPEEPDMMGALGAALHARGTLGR
ncbi:MAG: acyl-CoA dehydratase activase [Candidatus Brocadiia bacterium]